MDDDDRIKLRTEFWSVRPGAVRGLLLMARFDFCLAILMARDPDTRRWTYGMGRFPLEAFASSRSGFAERLDMTGDPGPMASAMGLISGMPETLVQVLMGCWFTSPSKINREATDNPGHGALMGIGFSPMASESHVIGKAIDAPIRPAPRAASRPVPQERIFVLASDAPIHAISGKGRLRLGAQDGTGA